MSVGASKFIATFTATLVGLALNLCVCAGAVRARASVQPADSSDPHACCKHPAETPESHQAPTAPADPCDSCPVKQKLGAAPPEHLAKLSHSTDAPMPQWPLAVPLIIASDSNAPALAQQGLCPPPLLDLFHTACQLSC